MVDMSEGDMRRMMHDDYKALKDAADKLLLAVEDTVNYSSASDKLKDAVAKYRKAAT